MNLKKLNISIKNPTPETYIVLGVSAFLLIVVIILIIKKVRKNKTYSTASLNLPQSETEIIEKLHPDLKPKAIEFLAKAKKAGLNIRITSGLRTFEQQQALYDQGRTKPGGIVTNAKPGSSYHNYGLAFDVIDKDKGYNADWQAIANIGKSIGLEWGGDWVSFKDKPHFQYKGLKVADLLKKYNSGQTENGYVIV